MASLGDVSRYLRQRRAIGKPITESDKTAAWSAYFDTEATKAIDRRRLAIQQEQFDEQMALNREKMENAEDAAAIKGVTDIALTGAVLSQTAVGEKAIAGVKGLTGIGGAQAGATQAISGNAVTMGVPGASVPATDAAAMSSSTGASSGAASGAGTATGIAAAVYADELLARNTAGTMDDPQAAWENNVRGITRYAGLTPGQTALLEKGVGKDNLDKVTDPFGVMEKIEGPMAEGTAATVPKVLGGTGEDPGSQIIDSVLEETVGSTWLCTKTRDISGFTKDEWMALSVFRGYAKKHHKEWLGFYVNVGPDLLKAINGDAKFFDVLKNSFVMPVIRLTQKGFYEAAYQIYKRITWKLGEKYAPNLLSNAPEGV